MKKNSFLVLALAMVAMVACKKKDEVQTPQQSETETKVTEISPIAALTGMATHMQASLAFSSSVIEASDGASQVSLAPKSSPKYILGDSSYPSVNWQPAEGTFWPVTVLVDFGADPVLGTDGRLHQGQLEVVASGLYLDSATLLNVTHKGFFVDGIEINAESETIFNEGKMASGNVSFFVDIKNGTLVNDSLDVVYAEQTHREFVAGVNDGIIDTDVTKHAYKITGTQTGLIRPKKACAIRDTLKYTYEVEQAMLVTVGKMFPTEGKLKITVENMVPVDNCTLTFKGEDPAAAGQYKAEINYMGAIIPVVMSKYGSYPVLNQIDLSGMSPADKSTLITILIQAGVLF